MMSYLALSYISLATGGRLELSSTGGSSPEDPADRLTRRGCRSDAMVSTLIHRPPPFLSHVWPLSPQVVMSVEAQAVTLVMALEGSPVRPSPQSPEGLGTPATLVHPGYCTHLPGGSTSGLSSQKWDGEAGYQSSGPREQPVED